MGRVWGVRGECVVVYLGRVAFRKKSYQEENFVSLCVNPNSPMKKSVLQAFVAVLLAASCGGSSHFLSDGTYRNKVLKDCDVRMNTLSEAFSPFSKSGNALKDGTVLTPEEKEALAFLYAYMPQADVTDYPASFFLANVRKSFQARDEMGWDVPEREFRHFVLPLRTNNEDLDSARLVFYDELKPRLKGLSMQEAILEVNHWCHEKMTYQPSDGRTHAPLASVKNALGRCGEESTFCVAALRSVGIPARQVYTPRWAHTESNHAWVEAWADGQWWFLGACEPEPVLNLGWFNAPASRAMLTHTKVFGRYDGPEEVVLETPGYTEINLIGNYAKSANALFRVLSADGTPVEGARVDFCIYNSSQFYPAVSKYTDAEGKTFLSAGLGDMLAWASKDGAYGFAKVRFGQDAEVVLTLDSPAGDPVSSCLLDIVPPPEDVTLPAVSAELRAENDRRMAHEDSVRKAYMAGFPDRSAAEALVEELHLPPQAASLVESSAGNGTVVTAFLRQAPDKARAVGLLASLSRKDLSDVPADILWDSYNAKESILSPRIESEFLSPYKGWFLENVPASLQEEFRGGGDPEKGARAILSWVRDHINVDEDPLFWDIPISPKGVWESRVANPRSRDLLVVALGRTFGIELQRDRLTGAMQYNAAKGEAREAAAPGRGMGPGRGGFRPRGDWRIVDLDQNLEGGDVPRGQVELTYEPVEGIDRPSYGQHYSVSRIVDGRPQMVFLGIGNDPRFGSSGLPEGDYLLCSGNRLSDGSTPVTLTLFHVTPGTELQVPLKIETLPEEVTVVGAFAAPEEMKADAGYYAAAVLDVGLEPTNHVLSDISAERAALEAWGRPIYLIATSGAQLERLHNEIDGNRYGPLPSTVVFLLDGDGSILSRLSGSLSLRADQLPLVIVGHTDSKVYFASQGYTIGMGARIAALARRL